MIVFGPIIFLFLFGIFCIFMDIIYTKDDQPEIQNKVFIENKSSDTSWIEEYKELDSTEKFMWDDDT